MIKPAENLLWEKIGDELVVLKTDSGKSFRLNHTGEMVWGMIAEGNSEEDIIHKLSSLFQESSEVFKQDMEAFLAELKSEGLVVYDV